MNLVFFLLCESRADEGHHRCCRACARIVANELGPMGPDKIRVEPGRGHKAELGGKSSGSTVFFVNTKT